MDRPVGSGRLAEAVAPLTLDPRPFKVQQALVRSGASQWRPRRVSDVDHAHPRRWHPAGASSISPAHRPSASLDKARGPIRLVRLVHHVHHQPQHPVCRGGLAHERDARVSAQPAQQEVALARGGGHGGLDVHGDIPLQRQRRWVAPSSHRRHRSGDGGGGGGGGDGGLGPAAAAAVAVVITFAVAVAVTFAVVAAVALPGRTIVTPTITAASQGP